MNSHQWLPSWGMVEWERIQKNLGGGVIMEIACILFEIVISKCMYSSQFTDYALSAFYIKCTSI